MTVIEHLRARGLVLAGWAVIAAIALAALGPMMDRLVDLPTLVAESYNEGWNAFLADAAMSGGALYPDATALSSNNYPPLSFYIVGLFGAAIGDNIIAGRLIAFASLLLVAFYVFLFVRRLDGSRQSALLAAFLFLGIASTYGHIYVALNDPQWLAHALMMSGFAVFFLSKRSLAMLAATAALMIAAGMVKHLLIAAPLAVTAWLAVYERQRLVAWIGVASALAIAALGACMLLYGENFLQSLIFTPRSMSLGLAVSRIASWFTILLLPATAAAFVAVWGWSRQTALVVFFVLASLLEALMAIGGAGVNSNAAFELIIGLTILSGLAVDRAASFGGGPARLLAMTALASCVLVASPARLQYGRDRILSLPERTAVWRSQVDALQAIDGPVACETLSLCYWAGKEFEVDFFIFGQKLETGVVTIDEALASLENRGVAAIQIETPSRPDRSDRLPAAFNDRLLERFEPMPARLSRMAILRRRPAF